VIYGILSTLVTALALPWAVIHGIRRGTPPCQVLSRLLVPRHLERCDIWLHGVSAGEIRALQPLVEHLQRNHPELRFTISTGTATGLQEAQQISGASPCFLLPYDLPWTMRRLVRALQPQWLLLSEGDLWMGMLQQVRMSGCRVGVVGAKVSDRSMRRWRLVPTLARRLYGLVDLFCAQSQEMASRLKVWARDPKLVVAVGSLKEERSLRVLDEPAKNLWRKRLGLHVDRPVLLLGSTHPGEEVLLLQAARPLLQQGWQIVICPRHPARLSQILAELAQQGLIPDGAVQQSSELQKLQLPLDHASAPIIVVAQFGVLTDLMQLSDVVVVGGSFLPGVGGHNILEPIQLGRPALWGPHMENQRSLEERVMSLRGGEAIVPADLAAACHRWKERVPERRPQNAEGTLSATWKALVCGLGECRPREL
jgi:3-deoxy-D-manno-octulosonic-acid transferase